VSAPWTLDPIVPNTSCRSDLARSPEAAQADYETLRAHLARHGVLPDDPTAARFARRGLITWPVSEPVFAGELLGAARAASNPYADERISALAAGFQFLLEAAATAQCRPATMGGRR
jgi:hypothetical protein